jgi:hypothetical protein
MYKQFNNIMRGSPVPHWLLTKLMTCDHKKPNFTVLFLRHIHIVYSFTLLKGKKSFKEEKEAFIHPYFTREKVPWCFCIFPRLPYFETHWDVKRKKNQLTKSSDTDMYPLAIPRYLEICTEIPTKPLQAYFRQFLWVLAWMQYWPLLILNDITPVPGLKPPNPGWTHWSSKRVRCRARL